MTKYANDQELVIATKIESAAYLLQKTLKEGKSVYPINSPITKGIVSLMDLLDKRRRSLEKNLVNGEDESNFMKLVDLLADIMADTFDWVSKETDMKVYTEKIATLRMMVQSDDPDDPDSLVEHNQIFQTAVDKAIKVAYHAGKYNQPVPILAIQQLVKPSFQPPKSNE